MEKLIVLVLIYISMSYAFSFLKGIFSKEYRKKDSDEIHRPGPY